MKTRLMFLLLFIPALFAGSTLLAQTDDSRVNVLTQENFKSSIKSGVHLVDFYADWCRPCKMLAPILEEIAFENEKFNISKLDVDKAKEISAEYSIRSIPCLIIFKDGVEVERIIGLQAKEKIVEKMNTHLK